MGLRDSGDRAVIVRGQAYPHPNLAQAVATGARAYGRLR
jgi:hypothetical protein